MYPTNRTEVIHHDRRDGCRYPIELELSYKLIETSRSQLGGVGRTLNMSSRGSLFYSDRSLPAGAIVELFIRWPVLRQNTCPVTLLIVGSVVRSDDHTVALKTSRYEFISALGREQELVMGEASTIYIV